MEQPPSPVQDEIELAVLDAPVLGRGLLTLFLLRLADAGAFDPVWSDQIHTEWTRDLHRLRPDIPLDSLRGRRLGLDRAFPVANVVPGREAQDEVLAHCTTPAERRGAHVLATALSARAAVIVTDDSFCLGGVMAKLWHDTAVLSPDAWCLELFDRREAAVLAGARAHRASLARTGGAGGGGAGGGGGVEAWLDALRAAPVGLPLTADRLAAHGQSL